MNLLNKHVHVRPDKLEDQTKSGILLNATLGEYPNTGIVLDHDPLIDYINDGDRVLFSPYAATELEDKTLLLTFDDIYGTLEHTDADAR